MATDRTDAELLSLYVAAGDKTAGDELVGRYVDFVYAAARRQLGDSHLAEDVTQAVFLLFVRRAKSIRAERLSGWLFSTVRYTCANARRMRTRRAYHEHRATVAEGQTTMQNCEDELLGQLDQGLSSLRRTDQQVLLMRYLQEREIEDVAAGMGISEVAARKRIGRALERLRAALAERGVTTLSAAEALKNAAKEKAPAGLHTAIAGGKPGPMAAAIYRKVVQMQIAKTVALAAAAVVMTAAGAGLGIGLLTRHVLAEPPAAPSLAADTTQPATRPADVPKEPKDQTAEVIRDENTLKQLGLGIYMYMADHGSRAPASLGELLDLVGSRRDNPAQRARVFFTAHDLAVTKIPSDPTAKWIDENTSWVFLAYGVDLSKAPPNSSDWLVLAYPKLDQGYTVVRKGQEPWVVYPQLKWDGHVDGENKEEAQWNVDRSKEAFDAMRKAR